MMYFFYDRRIDHIQRRTCTGKQDTRMKDEHSQTPLAEETMKKTTTRIGNVIKLIMCSSFLAFIMATNPFMATK